MTSSNQSQQQHQLIIQRMLLLPHLRAQPTKTPVTFDEDLFFSYLVLAISSKGIEMTKYRRWNYRNFSFQFRKKSQ